MLQGIEVLYWALSIVFCLALLFAILLWCRSWRREEAEAAVRQLQLLTREVQRLTAVVETLDATAATLQTADEQLTGHIETLRETARDLKRRNAAPAASRPAHASASQAAPASEPDDDVEERYEQARALLRSGRDPVEVARKLDLGTAEVRMISRLLDPPDTNA